MKSIQNTTGIKEDGSDYHIPVLFNEAIDGLAIRENGLYVDCTFGGGGHSRGILERLGPSGRLVVFDQDADAANNVPAGDSRVLFVPANFRYLQRFLRLNGIAKVDGILADLGVSSHQFDVGERGFSTRFDGPLDMRMDQRQPLTAAQVLKTYTEQQLHKLFERFGEVTNSKTLAKHIIAQRNLVPLQTISQLKTMLGAVVKGNPHKYLAQVFQALRIEVNDELGALKEMLEQTPAILNQGGRLAVITFHSIEDRLVKTFIKQGTFSGEPENPILPVSRNSVFSIITKKPVVASAAEQQYNPRSRSAKLRIAEKI